MAIHDPTIDAMLRNRPQQDQMLAVGAPINDVQLCAMMASHIVRNGADPEMAADLALKTFAEVCAQFRRFPQILQAAQQRQAENGQVTQ